MPVLTEEEAQRRLEVIRSFGRDVSLAEMARQIGVTPSTFVKWVESRGGLDAILEGRPIQVQGAITDDAAREAWEAVIAHGTMAGAARALDMPTETLRHRYNTAMRRGLHLSDGAREIVDKQKLGADARGGWLHHYDEGGKKLAATYWRPPEVSPETFAEQLRGALAEVPPAAPAQPPDYVDDDLLTLYPIADAHVGLLAWAKETGEAYDTSLAAKRIVDWIGKAIAASPKSGTAIILDVGDLQHADDQRNVTPKSQHFLDVDTRHYRTTEIVIAALVSATDAALLHHRRVIVRILPGNHNPHAYIGVMFSLAAHYRNEPRVEVRCSPSEFFVHQFGKVLIAAHHGDKAKADRMVHFIADSFAELWGKTRHRFLFTGHLHHHKSQDIGGVQWEQLRALTARDAYAVSHAYAARAQIQGITFHRERGEVMRVKVAA